MAEPLVACDDARLVACDDARLVAETLGVLQGQVGGADVVSMIVTTFLDGVAGRLEALAIAAIAGDHDGVGRTAHTLKSAAALVGLHGLSARAQALELAPTDAGHLAGVRAGLGACGAPLRAGLAGLRAG